MTEDILAQLQAATSGEEREWLALQFSLDSLTPELRQTVWAAAIPHWFDTSFLAALLARPVSAQEFASLMGLPFVKRFPDRGYNVHERSRALLLRRLWQDDVEHFRELSRRAADYCAAQDQTDAAWRIETIYHLLIAEPDKGADQLQNRVIIS